MRSATQRLRPGASSDGHYTHIPLSSSSVLSLLFSPLCFLSFSLLRKLREVKRKNQLAKHYAIKHSEVGTITPTSYSLLLPSAFFFLSSSSSSSSSSSFSFHQSLVAEKIPGGKGPHNRSGHEPPARQACGCANAGPEHRRCGCEAQRDGVVTAAAGRRRTQNARKKCNNRAQEWKENDSKGSRTKQWEDAMSERERERERERARRERERAEIQW